jgi:hypothetical protein
MTELIPLILGIVKDGLSLWSEERRTRFLKTHHKILEEIANEENKSYPEFSNARLDLANERLQLYLQAYWSELREESLGRLQPKPQA